MLLKKKKIKRKKAFLSAKKLENDPSTHQNVVESLKRQIIVEKLIEENFKRQTTNTVR